MIKIIRSTRAVAMGVCLAMSVSIAFAQQNQTATSAPEVQEGPDQLSGQLAEIVVTAERREESANKVPISLTALSQKVMDDLHIQSINDLSGYVPGLTIPEPQPSNQDYGDYAIRGIFSYGNAPTTQIYIDETPIAMRFLGAANSKPPPPEIFDLDRVEVLRGPQGTLFGASAMGGAIRFITPQPNLVQSSGVAKADLGFTEGSDIPNSELGAAYGAPIVPGVAAFRVSAWLQNLGGFIDRENPFTGEILQKDADRKHNYVIRPAVTVAPIDGLTITAALYMQQLHDDSPDSYWVNDLANPEHGSHVWGGIAQPATDNLRVSSLTIKYELPYADLVSDTSYLDRQYSGINDYTHAMEAGFAPGANPFIPGLNSFVSYERDLASTRAWQQEFRISSKTGNARVNWIAGLYYRRMVTGLSQLLPPDLTPLTLALFNTTSLKFFGVPDYVVNGQALNFYDDYHTTDLSEAAFADVRISLASRLRADVGVRYEHTGVLNQTQVFAGPYAFLGKEYSSITAPDATSNPLTPRFALTYQLTDDDMVYVSAAKGFRPGGANAVANINGNPLCQSSLQFYGLTGASPVFQPDSLWSYEIGSKDTLFDKHATIDASAYYIKYTNIQNMVFLDTCATGFTVNYGEAVSQGFDLQLDTIVSENLRAGLTVGYDNAYYPRTIYGPAVNGVAPVRIYGGDKLGAVVPWTADANAEYSLGLGSIWENAESYLRADYVWRGSGVKGDVRLSNDMQIYNHPRVTYGLLNMRLGVRHGGWDLSIYALNVTGADPEIGYYHDFVGEPLFFAGAIRPRTFGVTGWYRF